MVAKEKVYSKNENSERTAECAWWCLKNKLKAGWGASGKAAGL